MQDQDAKGTSTDCIVEMTVLNPIGKREARAEEVQKLWD
jgi:hypothetical protein